MTTINGILGNVTRRYSADSVEPAMRPDLAITQAVTLLASTTFPKGSVIAEITGTNAVQTIALSSATGGTFTVTFNGYTTPALAYNVSAANLLIALINLASIGNLNVTVTLSSTTYTVTFVNQLGSMVQNLMTANATLLTGAGAAIAVATTTPGVAGSNGLFTLYNSGASDGTQTAKAILKYACLTDVSGNITFGDGTNQMDNGSTILSAPAYFRGIFYAKDVPLLNSTIITSLGGRLVQGAIAARGIFEF